MRQYLMMLTVSSSLCSVAIGQTGGISGTITTVSGSPVAGATVTYRRLPAFLPKTGPQPQLAPGEVQFGASATTDAKGNHAAQAVPAGTYTVCVDAQAQPFLDPCKWSAAPNVQVKSGQTSVLNIPLQLGVFLQIRFNDPHSLLTLSEITPLDFPHVITGAVFGKGAFLAARRVGTDSAGQNYRMSVPSGVPLNLWLFSKDVLLTDSQGKEVSATGSQIPFQAVAGANQLFTVTVTGRRLAAQA
jgi:hypothetical protein